jgi:hypothetical protein
MGRYLPPTDFATEEKNPKSGVTHKFHEYFSLPLKNRHEIELPNTVSQSRFRLFFGHWLVEKTAEKYSPFGRFSFAHLLRYQGLAVPLVQLRP